MKYTDNRSEAEKAQRAGKYGRKETQFITKHNIMATTQEHQTKRTTREKKTVKTMGPKKLQVIRVNVKTTRNTMRDNDNTERTIHL